MGSEKVNDKPVIGITLDQEGDCLRLRRNYSEAILHSGGIPLMIPPGNDPYLIAETIDGLLIPGGGDIDPSYYAEEVCFPLEIVMKERTDFEMNLFLRMLEQRRPIFGICYGMQLMNVALGGSLYQDLGFQYGKTVEHGNGIHRITGTGEMFQGEHMVNSSHHQGIKKLGSGLTPVAFSDDGLIEAVLMEGHPFLIAVQWHPERSDDALSQGLFRLFVEQTHVSQ